MQLHLNRRVARIRLIAAAIFLALLSAAAARTARVPRFAPSILARWHMDDDFYYLESYGIPTHKMMVGITAWQQQVPLPQDFTGDNAFKIPRHPVMADKPVSAKSALFSGAIAVAINGVPIFNPIKNDGRTDTLVAGELDDFGGHCGRADDYHYHIAPLHLVDVAGIANPIGYALDGYLLYGLTEADGSDPIGLDEFNGHTDSNGVYHYHSTKKYPYINGGMRGVVQVQNDAIAPQPRTVPVRPAGDQLARARIVGFTWPGVNRYSLEYDVAGERRFVNYSVNGDNTYTFQFVDGSGATRTETYRKGNGQPPPRPNKLVSGQ